MKPAFGAAHYFVAEVALMPYRHNLINVFLCVTLNRHLVSLTHTTGRRSSSQLRVSPYTAFNLTESERKKMYVGSVFALKQHQN